MGRHLSVTYLPEDNTMNIICQDLPAPVLPIPKTLARALSLGLSALAKGLLKIVCDSSRIHVQF